MSGDPDENDLPPSASRRSVLAGAAGLAALPAVNTAEASSLSHGSDNGGEGGTMNLVTDLEQHDDFPETIVGVSVAQMDSRKKYEYRQDIPGIILDRMLHSEVRYPGDYGFVPQTAMEDGDPLDVLVLLESSLFPGCVLDVRPVGVLRMTDEGEKDDKVVGVPADDPRFAHIEHIDDVPQHERDEIAEFFRTYKNLEPGGDISVDGFDNPGAARVEISNANDRFESL